MEGWGQYACKCKRAADQSGDKQLSFLLRQFFGLVACERNSLLDRPRRLFWNATKKKTSNGSAKRFIQDASSKCRNLGMAPQGDTARFGISTMWCLLIAHGSKLIGFSWSLPRRESLGSSCHNPTVAGPSTSAAKPLAQRSRDCSPSGSSNAPERRPT